MRSDIGKIYAKFDLSLNDFVFLRIVSKNNDLYKIENYFPYADSYGEISKYSLSKNPIKDMIKDGYTLLSPDGYMCIHNVNAFNYNNKPLEDVMISFFKKNDKDYTLEVVARQIIDNPEKPNIVGYSHTLNTIESSNISSLNDVMYCAKVIDSKEVNVYKTDTLRSLTYLLQNTKSEDILYKGYIHECDRERQLMGYSKDHDFGEEINGYCDSLSTFISKSGFVYDFYNTLGIGVVDFPIYENYKLPKEGSYQLSEEEKYLLSALYGGIKIDKTFITKFTYEIDLDKILMKYLLIKDSNDILWIIGYTEDKSDIVPALNDELINDLHKRLKSCAKKYNKL